MKFLRLLLPSSLILGLALLAGCETVSSDVCIQYQVDWCGFCHAQQPAFEQWATVKGVYPVVLDITNDPRARVRNGIVSYPTYIYYRNGVELYRVDHVSKLYVPE